MQKSFGLEVEVDVLGLQIRIDKVRNDAQMREYARSMALAFENYPVMTRAFPNDRLDWIEKMVYGIAAGREKLKLPTPVAIVGDEVVGGMSLYFPGYDNAPEIADWWKQFLKDAGAHTENFFTRFIELAESVPMPSPNLYLAMIGVHPEFQRKGVGAALIEHALQMAREHPGVKGVGLDTEIEANLKIYERFGFKVLDQVALDDLPLWLMFCKV